MPQSPTFTSTASPYNNISTTYHCNNEWPPDDTIEHLLEIYIKHCEVISPIIDFDGLRDSVKNKTCNSFLLYSILSVAARFSNRLDVVEDPLWVSGEKYAIKARSMIADVIESPSIDHIQGLLILCINEYGCARGPRCWMYVGIAARMALELGLNRELIFEEVNPGTVLTKKQWLWYESRRKVYWNTFINDMLASAINGRPQMLNSADTDILLPIHDRALDWKNNSNGLIKDGDEFYQKSVNESRLVRYTVICVDGKVTGIRMTPIDLTVTPSIEQYYSQQSRPLSYVGLETHCYEQFIILGKITQFINRGFKDFAQKDIQELNGLNNELDKWEERLPMNLRMTPANLERYRQEESHKASLFIMSHMLQNGLIILLNRASLVLADMPRFGQVTQEMQDLIQKSREKCLAAADNFTVMLKDITSRFELVHPNTIYFAYATATVMVNNSFSTNPEECKKAENSLQELFKFFEGMKRYWVMSDKMNFLIRDLYSIHQKVIDNYRKSMDSSQRSISSSPGTNINGTFTEEWNLKQQYNDTVVRRIPLADISLSSSGGLPNYNYLQQPTDTVEQQQQSPPFVPFNINRTNNLSFLDPNSTLGISSFDIWLQQQQQLRK
ncbi:MAG: fungal-specific transcription factor domain-containing protein [Benjaminiella poitrasii]|nr:MAG: fungal-specific transcription factor domain-containing protein [Benjaminiella poitrasii]